MSVKKFFAPTLREALNLVKDTLGEEALIISQQPVHGGIEVLAQPDYPKPAPKPSFSKTVMSSAPAFSEWLYDPNIDHLKTEVTQLKVLLQEQLTQFAWHSAYSNKPWLSVIYERLLKEAVEPEAAKEIVERITHAKSLEEAESLIGTWIIDAFTPPRQPLYKSSFFIGPVGSGKTAALVSMVLQYAKHNALSEICVVSYTPKKLSTFDELRCYMRFFDIPVIRCETEAELKNTLEKQGHQKKVFCELGADLEASTYDFFHRLFPDFQFYLTTPLFFSYPFLQDWVKKVASIKNCYQIITQAQHTLPVGNLISLHLSCPIPIMLLLDGEPHPTHLKPFYTEWLAERFPFAALKKLPFAVTEEQLYATR